MSRDFSQNPKWDPTRPRYDSNDEWKWQQLAQNFLGKDDPRNKPEGMFLNYRGDAVHLNNMYQNASVFLIGGGPSFLDVDHSLLSQPGIVTMGMNNVAHVYRPDLWVCVDLTDHFIRSVWYDPRIMKFCPTANTLKPIWNSGTTEDDVWEWTQDFPFQQPNTFFFKREENHNIEWFFDDSHVNWGSHKKFGGNRSVMLAAFRILYSLGFKNVYLLGVDFKMDENTKYSFKQSRHEGSLKGNNSIYKKNIERFKDLKLEFDKRDFNVYNCNKESKLEVFPFMDFQEAIDKTIEERKLNFDLSKEQTDGLYNIQGKVKSTSRKPK